MLANAHGRRARDQVRVAERPVYGQLGDRGLEDLILLIDDDLRETAQAIEDIERYLVRALRIVDGSLPSVASVSERRPAGSGRLSRESVTALADDPRVSSAVDRMTDLLAGLRRRLGDLAERLP